MDRLANLTRGINATTSAPVTGQTCVSNSSNSAILDKSLVTAPSWSSVQQDLRWMFLLHTYGIACLFFVLGFYTFFSILNLRSLISSRPYMSTINIFLCLLGASRAACLFIDPYNLKETMPKIIGSITWDIGYPCITSAFCLIQLAFLQLTKLKFGPEKIQKESCLSLIITAHFFFIIASNITLSSHNCYMARYVVQAIFLVWSILLYLAFLHAAYKVDHLLRTMPSSMLTRDNSNVHQKGIMQLAMLAPYSNLATSVAAALVPTLLGPKMKGAEESEPANISKSAEGALAEEELRITTTAKVCKVEEPAQVKEIHSVVIIPTCTVQSPAQEQKSAVPEVYVRPPTPTPSTVNLPIITVSSPSRRSSVGSRRSSDASNKSSRRNSECSVRFVNEEDDASMTECKRVTEGSPRHTRIREVERSRSPDGTSRRFSESITPTGSTRELRRCSDFTHEKNRSSQFATKLRRNSDFGNRTPRRMLPTEEQSRLPRVLDLSPTGSRRNSDIGTFVTRPDSRRNSESTYRRNSEFVHIKPLVINRRSSDISIRTLDRSPTHFQSIVPVPVPVKTEGGQEKSESDSDQPDCSEKAALMNEKSKGKDEEVKVRKKNLSWNDKSMEDPENITAETNLLPENTTNEARLMGTDFTLHSILNHIAYVNRAKSDTPLHIPETDTAAARKSQVKRVLNVTRATAILGIILCFTDAFRIFGPYGLFAETVPYGTEPVATQYPKPWPWLLYQTLYRAFELAMGYAMASITKQPSISPRHQYLSGYPNYSPRVKRGNNPYI